MISNKFGAIAAGAFALSMAFTAPAMAGSDFIKKDLRDRSTELAQVVGQRLSANKLTFVVHGGNDKLMGAAYRVAMRLDDEGVPVAFLLAPDRDGVDMTMHVDFYGKGSTRYGASVYDNDKSTVASNEAGMYKQAMKAVREDFPQYASVSGATATIASTRILASN